MSQNYEEELQRLLGGSDAQALAVAATAAEEGRAARVAAYGANKARPLGFLVPAAVRRAVAPFGHFKLPEVIPYEPHGAAAWEAFGAGITHDVMAEKFSTDYWSVQLLLETGRLGMLKHAKQIVGVETPSHFVVIGHTINKGNSLPEMLRATTLQMKKTSFSLGQFSRVTFSKTAISSEADAGEVQPHSVSELKVRGWEKIPALISGRVEPTSKLVEQAYFAIDMAHYVEVGSPCTVTFSFGKGVRQDEEWAAAMSQNVKQLGRCVAGVSHDAGKLRVRLTTPWTCRAISMVRDVLGAVYAEPASKQKAQEYRRFIADTNTATRDSRKAATVTARKEARTVNVSMTVQAEDGGRMRHDSYNKLVGALRVVRAIGFAGSLGKLTCEVDDAVALQGATLHVGGKKYVVYVEHLVEKPIDDAARREVQDELDKMEEGDAHWAAVQEKAKLWGVSDLEAVAAAMAAQAPPRPAVGAWADAGGGAAAEPAAVPSRE
jgi:hypothetical protein